MKIFVKFYFICRNFQTFSIFTRPDQLSVTLLMIIAVIFITPLSCVKEDNNVKEYFTMHGLSYPVDYNGVTLMNVTYVNIERDELMGSGARDFIENGIIFIKVYFQSERRKSFMQEAIGLVVESPVLFRDEKGEVGLMVKVSAYGTGESVKTDKSLYEIIDNSERLWKKENFAYFVREGFSEWRHEGWVY